MTNQTNSTPEKIRLRDGSWVDTSFYYNLRYCVADQIKNMVHGRAKTLRKICGESFWELFPERNRAFVGMCVATMVERGELELIAVSKNSSNHALYRRK